MSHAWSLAALAAVLLAFIALESWRPHLVSPAIAFTAAGLLIGPEVLGWVDVAPNAESLRLLAEATLALVLFADASRIDLRALRDGYALPARLLGIGLPLTIVAGTLAALAVLPTLAWEEALVLAIVLAATDAALGQAVVTDERLPTSLRQGLNVESGLNDGLCVPALVIALTLADTATDALSGAEAGRVIAESIGYGLLMGAVAGVAAAAVQRRATTSGDEEQAQWRFLLTLVAAGLAYGLAVPLGGSGFIASFVAGLIFGGAGRARRDAAPLQAQDLGALLNALTFILFGAAFLRPLLERTTWDVALYALLSLTVVRMLPVAIATLGTRSSPATIAYLGWFGPRGLASIVFAVIVVDTGIPHTSTIVDAAALTVTASLVLHGLTAGRLTERYTRRLQARSSRTGLEAAVTTVHVPPAGRRWPRSVEPDGNLQERSTDGHAAATAGPASSDTG
jgi:sodium/hydrogen antiporter